MLIKLIGVGLIGAMLSVFTKQYRPETGIMIPVLTSAVLLGMCLPYISALINMFESIGEAAGINGRHIKTVIKIIGVAYICQFASDICRDSGETAVASKIELGGKVIIISMSMPIIFELLEIISKIISF